LKELIASIFRVEAINQVQATDFPAGGIFCLPPALLLFFAELISSTLKMEAICSSETSVET
jgi:hypothetical protein